MEDGEAWDMYILAEPMDRQVLVYSVLDEQISPDLRVKVNEFITRANFGLSFGNFEMDFDDGEMRFKTSLSLNNEPLTEGLLDQLIMTNLAAMQDYLPSLQEVLSGKLSPEEAIEKSQAEIEDLDFDG